VIGRRSLLLGAAALLAAPRWSWAAVARATGTAFPAGLAPEPLPAVAAADGSLPPADVVVMVDTTAEADAAADVLTPGVARQSWTPYTKNYAAVSKKVGPHGPSHESKRLGSYCLTRIAGLTVLVYKTELHLHTDGPALPVKDLLAQVIDDVQPRVFLTTGTAGGVYQSMELGDVVVSRAARFYCERDFKDAPFNGKTFTSDWTVPTAHLVEATVLVRGYAPHLSGKAAPPSKDCAAYSTSVPRGPSVFVDGAGGIPAFHPILTTDFFEFGTSANRLDKLGLAVEMDDAVLGLVCGELKDPPRWACVRNLSDPTINGALAAKVQGRCAEFYYKRFGYWTTVNSSLAAWAIVAGL